MKHVLAVYIFLGCLGLFAGDKVDINKADKATLETIKGIGSAKAQAIIDYRTENGPFSTVDDLQKVSGIGAATLEKLKPMITVSAPTKQPEPEKVSSGPLDLNTASKEELQKLPKIGPTLASRIITYRQANGPFRSVDELKNIEGIHQSTIEGFSSDVTVGNTKATAPSSPKTGDAKPTGRKLKVWHPKL